MDTREWFPFRPFGKLTGSATDVASPARLDRYFDMYGEHRVYPDPSPQTAPAARRHRFEALDLRLERAATQVADWVLDLNPVTRNIIVVGALSSLLLGFVLSKLS